MKLNKLTEKLAAFEPGGFPFISLYLDAQHNGDGSEDFRIWIKKEMAEAVKEFAEDSDEAKKVNTSLDQIQHFLETETDPAANGISSSASAVRSRLMTCDANSNAIVNMLIMNMGRSLYAPMAC